jgi:hypothetical protein
MEHIKFARKYLLLVSECEFLWVHALANLFRDGLSFMRHEKK